MVASLTKIKAFVYTYANSGEGELTSDTVDAVRIFIEDAVATVYLNIDLEIQKKSPENERTQFTEEIQLAVTGLLDDLILNPGVSQEIEKVFRFISEKLTGLLGHLYHFFPNNFNISIPAPKSFFFQERNNRLRKINELVSILRKWYKDEEPAVLICEFLTAVPSDRFFPRNWHQWSFFLNFIGELESFLEMPPQIEKQTELMKFLISVNFNNLYIYSFFLKFLEGLQQGDRETGALEHDLFYLLKIIRQIGDAFPAGFDPDSRSLKDLVRGSITAELKYIAQKEKFFMKSLKLSEDSRAASFYFTVMVTLAELMFLFRIMIETQFIQTKFNAHLYEFISRHIRTKRAENLSKKSMRNRFGAKPFSDRIVNNIREWLLKMVKHIDLHYR